MLKNSWIFYLGFFSSDIEFFMAHALSQKSAAVPLPSRGFPLKGFSHCLKWFRGKRILRYLTRKNVLVDFLGMTHFQSSFDT